MGQGRIQLYRTVPGPTGLEPLVRAFCKNGEGILTAFDDAALPALAEFRPDEDWEVVPFSSLVSKILASSGESHGRLAAAGHQQASIAQALAELPQDALLASGAGHPGLHRALLRTIHELHGFGWDAEAMLEAAETLPKALGRKISEIAQVDKALQAILNQIGLETHSRQLKACENALIEADGQDRRIFVLIGGERAPARLRWLNWAVSAGWDLTVVVERHATDGTLFRGAEEAIATLGVTVTEVGHGHRLLNDLFARSHHGGPALKLTVQSAPDPLAECEWALRGCLEEGDESAGLYVRDLETYAPLLRAASVRLGIPIQMSQRMPLLTNAFARLTLNVVEFTAARGVLGLRAILPSSYLGLTLRERNEIQSALREAHRTGDGAWSHLGQWAISQAERFPWLIKLLAWRDAARASAEDLGGWLDRLRSLVHELPWHTKMTGRDARAYDIARDARAFSAMQNVLANEASVERAMGAGPFDLATFARRCTKLWEAADVSLPSSDQGILVANRAAALTGVRTLYVLGMLEGSFPRRASQDPILSDHERELLSDLKTGWPSLPLSRDRAGEERDEFYRVCAAATHHLVLSYPQADDVRDNVPAFYIEAAADAAGEVERRDLPRTLLAPERELCYSKADLDLRTALDAPRERPEPVLLESPEAREKVASSNPERTPAELRDALRCGFLYAARHRLRLRPGRRAERWSQLRSLPQTARLAATSHPNQAQQALIDALETQLESLIGDVPEWEIPLLRAGGRRLIDAWVEREFKSREIWPIDDGSLRLNVPFGDEEIRSKLPYGTTLTGVAPAISRRFNTKTMHLYGLGLTKPEEMTEADKLFLGVHLLSLYEPGVQVGLEVDSSADKRTFLRISGGNIRQDRNSGLECISMSQEDDRFTATKSFFDEVRKYLQRAVTVAQAGEMRPQPGDACEYCEFGELCRRARGFSEEDSPFGADLGSRPGGAL